MVLVVVGVVVVVVVVILLKSKMCFAHVKSERCE